MNRFNFDTFRLYRSGFRHHTISWAWWGLIKENNPLIEKPHYNPAAEMPWDIPF